MDFISSGQKPLRARVDGMKLCSLFSGRHCGNTSMFSCSLSVGRNKGGYFTSSSLLNSFLVLTDGETVIDDHY